MNLQEIEELKTKIYHSVIPQYVDKEKIRDTFEKINLKAYTTMHTATNGILHELSKKVDEPVQNTKTNRDINEKASFSKTIYEGCTDYLTIKINKEDPKDYAQSEKLFVKLDKMLIKSSNDPNILMKIYINKDANYIKQFFIKYGNIEQFKEIYNNYTFMKKKDIDKILNPIEKNLNKDIRNKKIIKRFDKILENINKVFNNNQINKLNEKNYIEEQKNGHEKFTEKYSQNINLKTEKAEKQNEKNSKIKEKDERELD